MQYLPLVLKFLVNWWRESVIVALAVVLAVSVHSCNARNVAKGVAIEKERVADSTLTVVTPKLAKADTAIVHDTVTVRRLVARVDTLRDTVLKHLTDTLLLKQYITRGDSLAQACTELSTDCAAFRAYATQTIAALQSKVGAAPAIQVKSCVAPSILSGLAGAAAGYLAHR